MSTLFYHPSVLKTAGAKAIQAKTQTPADYAGFLSALSQADERYMYLQKADPVQELAEEYGATVTSEIFVDEEALALFAQEQAGVANLTIAPNILATMETDGIYRRTIMQGIDEYFTKKVPAAQEQMRNMGHEALAMGYVVRHDGSNATWVHGNYTTEERLDIMAASMGAEAGEESHAMREARRRVEQEETIRDFSVRRAMTALQDVSPPYEPLNDILYV